MSKSTPPGTLTKQPTMRIPSEQPEKTIKTRQVMGIFLLFLGILTVISTQAFPNFFKGYNLTIGLPSGIFGIVLGTILCVCRPKVKVEPLKYVTNTEIIKDKETYYLRITTREQRQADFEILIPKWGTKEKHMDILKNTFFFGFDRRNNFNDFSLTEFGELGLLSSYGNDFDAVLIKYFNKEINYHGQVRDPAPPSEIQSS